jgi:AcrR family transcriptional regulator
MKAATTVGETASTGKRAALGTRARQAQDTRATLLRVAIQVFARDGYAGGRIEKISRLARSHDRMIYYYFGSKEKLFVEVLETIYAQLNEAESRLNLDLERPLEALAELVRFTWRYYLAHPEFVTILNSENLHRGQHARQSAKLGSISAVALSILADLLARGQAQRVIRRDVGAREVYLMIASLGYFYNSNRYTLSAFLEHDLMAPQALADWEQFIVKMVLSAIGMGDSARNSVANAMPASKSAKAKTPSVKRALKVKANPAAK